MSPEEAVVARIQQLAAVTALVSTRVYLLVLPQSTVFPAVRVQVIDQMEMQHLRGPHGLETARVQIDAYAKVASGSNPYTTASALMEAIHGDGLGPGASGVYGWTGQVGSPAFQIVNCRPVRLSKDFDAEELNVVTVSRDYLVDYIA
jgi:hypothetical protein